MSRTNARTTLKVVRKTTYTIVLLTIAAVTGATGNDRVSATEGYSSELTCTQKSNTTMVTWKISPKVGGHCSLGYRADRNETDRTNCSESMNWKSRPDQDPTLEIRQVKIAHEGNYTCEVVAPEGNFHRLYHLTVLVPPRSTLYCDEQGNPVCIAAAGKPAAQISWVLENNSTPNEEGHDNGTVTVFSKFTPYGTKGTNTTCIVSHPAGNWSKSIACDTSENSNFTHYVSIIVCSLTIITFVAVIYRFKLHHDRTMRKLYKPRPPPDAELSQPSSNSGPEL